MAGVGPCRECEQLCRRFFFANLHRDDDYRDRMDLHWFCRGYHDNMVRPAVVVLHFIVLHSRKGVRGASASICSNFSWGLVPYLPSRSRLSGLRSDATGDGVLLSQDAAVPS